MNYVPVSYTHLVHDTDAAIRTAIEAIRILIREDAGQRDSGAV